MGFLKGTPKQQEEEEENLDKETNSKLEIFLLNI